MHKKIGPGLRVLIGKSSGAKTLKTGPNCNYFSTSRDCGLNIEKMRGSLTIVPGRRGMRDPRPSDLDLAARI